MANELQSPGGNLTFNKGVQNVSIPLAALSITVTGKSSIHGEVGLTTSDLSLNKGLIGTIGWAYVRNEDPTNNALVGADGVAFPIIIPPGQYYNGPWGNAAIHAKASAGTPSIEYCLIEL